MKIWPGKVVLSNLYFRKFNPTEMMCLAQREKTEGQKTNLQATARGKASELAWQLREKSRCRINRT